MLLVMHYEWQIVFHNYIKNLKSECHHININISFDH